MKHTKIFKRMTLIIGGVPASATLITAVAIPPAAVIVLLGGILIWIICLFFLLVSGYLFK